MEKVFLYKLMNSDDRDCVAYIDSEPMKFECDHYFSGVILSGACYSSPYFADYEEIKTVLTEEEYKQLIKFNEEIKELGHGIVKGDERYNKGIALCESIQPVYDKLLSAENQDLFTEVMEEEIQWIMDNEYVSREEVVEAFEYYRENLLDYQDRSIICHIYDNEEELAEDYVFNNGLIDRYDDFLNQYINYQRMGEDIAWNTQYFYLDNGRIVEFAM